VVAPSHWVGSVVLAETPPVPGLSLDGVTITGAALTLVVAYVLARLLATGLEVLSEEFVTYRISIRMLVPVVKFVVYGAALYYILGPLLQLSSTQLLAVSGLLGAGLGFGLKDLFANVIGGLVLLVARPYQVGDKVTFGEHYGEVVDIDLRSTAVRTPDDSVVAVPNYSFVTDAVVNANTGNPEMMVVVEFRIARDADVARAMAIVEDALASSGYIYVDENCPFTVLVEDEPLYRTVRGKAYVNDLRNEFPFKSDVTERVLAAFDEDDIERPSARVLADDGDLN
jgi:small-conductance mechanosensitive channel